MTDGMSEAARERRQEQLEAEAAATAATATAAAPRALEDARENEPPEVELPVAHDAARIESTLDVHLVYEAAVRNMVVDENSAHMRAYDRFTSTLLTLRQGLMSSRWPNEVRRVIDASVGMFEETEINNMISNSDEEVIKALRGDGEIKCMFCQQPCAATSMRTFSLFGQRGSASMDAHELGRYSAEKWIKSSPLGTRSELHKRFVQFEKDYECVEIYDDIKHNRFDELTPEHLGSFAVGSDCARMLEATMWVQSQPNVLMWDISDRLRRTPKLSSKSFISSKNDAIETLDDLELVTRFLARGGANCELPTCPAPTKTIEACHRFQEAFAMKKHPTPKKQRSFPRSVVVPDDQFEKSVAGVNKQRLMTTVRALGARAREALCGHIGASASSNPAHLRKSTDRQVVELSDDDEAFVVSDDDASAAPGRRGRGEKNNGHKRARASEKRAKVSKVTRARKRRVVDDGSDDGSDGGSERRNVRPRSVRCAAHKSKSAVRAVLEDEATGEGFEESQDEAPDHLVDEEQAELQLFKDTMRATRLSIETQREEQMIDTEGYSAEEMSRALAASAPPPPPPSPQPLVFHDRISQLAAEMFRISAEIAEANVPWVTGGDAAIVATCASNLASHASGLKKRFEERPPQPQSEQDDGAGIGA